MTVGSAAEAGLRLIVWCRGCGHQVEPDPIQLAERYGTERRVLDWRERLVCAKCGGRDVDFVVSGTKRAGVSAQQVALACFPDRDSRPP
jgi:hypothetical protein